MDLSNLRHKRDYYKHAAPEWVRNVFRNYNSFDWFCKNNRDTLIDAGALFRLGRDQFVDTEKFLDQVIKLRGLPVDGPV